MVQWLGLHASTVGGPGLIPGQGTKILQAAWCGQKKKDSKGTHGYPVKRLLANSIPCHSSEPACVSSKNVSIYSTTVVKMENGSILDTLFSTVRFKIPHQSLLILFTAAEYSIV